MAFNKRHIKISDELRTEMMNLINNYTEQMNQKIDSILSTIQPLGSPDYNRASGVITLSPSRPYTVPDIGYVSIVLHYYPSSNLYCNGVPIGVVFYSRGNFAYAQVAFVPVTKGDVITLTAGTATLRFIPSK